MENPDACGQDADFYVSIENGELKMIEITDKAIDIQKIIEAAASGQAGAINTFIGTVRDNTKGKKVLRLEYEAYEPMAISEIKKIIEVAKERWNLTGFAVSHRVGTLLPGETAVVVAISTPHRKASFEACQFIIDTLKETVPIWKREFFENGDQWVSAHP
jgi:molybdopterin synthase catalytic subunit